MAYGSFVFVDRVAFPGSTLRLVPSLKLIKPLKKSAPGKGDSELGNHHFWGQK